MATGWGNKTWGAAEWGDLSNETVSISGISATTSIGSSTTQANADVGVTGSQLTFTNAGAVAGASADTQSPVFKQIFLWERKILQEVFNKM